MKWYGVYYFSKVSKSYHIPQFTIWKYECYSKWLLKMNKTTASHYIYVLFIPKRKHQPTGGISTEQCSGHGMNVTYKMPYSKKTNNVKNNILFSFYIQMPFNNLISFKYHYMFKAFKSLPGIIIYKLYMEHSDFSQYFYQEP